MRNTFTKFFQAFGEQLGAIGDILSPLGKEHEAKVNALTQTVGVLSEELEAREAALEKTVKELEQTLSSQRQLGLFFILYTLFITLFSFISAFLNQTLPPAQLDVASPAACLGFLMILIALAVVQIKLSPFPLSTYGLTLKGSGRAIKESIGITLPLIAAVTAVRWWCGSHVESFQGKPFFDTSAVNFIFWGYIFIAFGQEFVARGVVQGLIFRLLGGKHQRFWSIFLASLIFGVTHTYYSFWLSLVSVVGGFLLGWLYSRHQTIVGVSIAHFVVGNYLVLTGFWSLLQ